MISFSMIVPVFNVENYIEKCLLSIINQTEKPHEVILIDDGSTDKTKEICDSYEKNFPFIKVIHCAQRGGVSNARNRGLDIATGEYILFVDGDDEVSGFLIEALKSYIEQSKSEMYIYAFTRIKAELVDGMDSLKGIQSCSASEMKDRWIAGDKRGGYVCNTVWKRSVIEENHIRFDIKLGIFEDMKFFYQYLECCSSVSVCDDALYYYREREGSAVKTITADRRWQNFHTLDYIRKQEKKYKNDVNISRLCKQQIGFAWLYLQRVVIEKKHSTDRTDAVVAFIKKYYLKTGIVFNTEQFARLVVCFLKSNFKRK